MCERLPVVHITALVVPGMWFDISWQLLKWLTAKVKEYGAMIWVALAFQLIDDWEIIN